MCDHHNGWPTAAARQPCNYAISLKDHNGDDAITWSPGIEFSPHVLVHGKSWPLIAAESERGGCAVAKERHKRDCRPVDGADLENANEPVDRRDSWTNSSADKKIFATDAAENQHDH
jgi:hypothetical protein